MFHVLCVVGFVVQVWWKLICPDSGLYFSDVSWKEFHCLLACSFSHGALGYTGTSVFDYIACHVHKTNNNLMSNGDGTSSIPKNSKMIEGKRGAIYTNSQS